MAAVVPALQIPGLMGLPPTPSNPPTDLDLARTHAVVSMLSDDFENHASKGNTTRLRQAFEYQGNMDRARRVAAQGPLVDAPPWFVAFATGLNTQLTDMEYRLTTRLTRVEVCVAKALNQHRRGTVELPLTVVILNNGCHPVQEAHLPPLETIDAVDALHGENLQAYFLGYGGHAIAGIVTDDMRKEFIIRAIGATRLAGN